MKILWDDAKNNINRGKHGVSFNDTSKVLGDDVYGSGSLCGFREEKQSMKEIPELTEEQFARAIPARVRKRLVAGQVESGADIVALRRFIGLTQAQFAQAMTISVHTLRNWEQDRRRPVGPALGLLRIAARHPRIIRENVEAVA